ncbi:MAG TPA: hypothetical protein VNK82_07515 [Terriglobales bacterium]|nr:hypothetical protein [Terriglobales bacterium]
MNNKWRKSLSISMLVISLFLFASRAYRLSRDTAASHDVHGGVFRERGMIETKLIHCVNLPALVLSAPVRLPLSNAAIGPETLYIGQGFFFSYGDLTYLIVIFLFWWWVGKQIDERARKPLRGSVRWLYGLFTVLSLALTAIGILSLTPLAPRLYLSASPDWEYPIAALLWGTLLSAYFIAEVRRSSRG